MRLSPDALGIGQSVLGDVNAHIIGIQVVGEQLVFHCRRTVIHLSDTEKPVCIARYRPTPDLVDFGDGLARHRVRP